MVLFLVSPVRPLCSFPGTDWLKHIFTHLKSMSPLTTLLRKISLLNTIRLKVCSYNFIKLVAHMRSWTYVAIMTGMDFPEHRNLSPQFPEPHNRFLSAPSHLPFLKLKDIPHIFRRICFLSMQTPSLKSSPNLNWKYVFCSLESGNGSFSEVESSAGNEKAKVEERQVSSTPAASDGLLLTVPL